MHGFSSDGGAYGAIADCPGRVLSVGITTPVEEHFESWCRITAFADACLAPTVYVIEHHRDFARPWWQQLDQRCSATGMAGRSTITYSALNDG